MSVAAPVVVGAEAPDFRLKGPGGQFVTLSEYRGRKHVVLVFFPLAFSPVCSHQLPTIQEELGRFRTLGAEVLGISVDSHFANEAYARHLGLGFPLLSDFRHAASRGYGVFLPEYHHSARALFVVDKGGRIAYRDVSPTPDAIPSNAAVLEALEALS
jgi:peroxiredoxin